MELLSSLFGDPHINTLDEVKYTFNGLGEFILTNVKDENGTVIFRLQGRTARASNGTHETQATNFVGLAAIIQEETTIEWILQGSNSTIVKLNGTEFTLPDNSTYVSKITLEKTSKDEIKASFDGGISITVSANEGALSFVTMLETIYKSKTEGLLGKKICLPDL
ncbi:mucin-4-like [Ranitomeya variabilis]|uniref:mucin-4-like n=1 Tax=Ranitomeya variabilis TaxID=490064 RepID=UPI0040578605